MKGDLSVNSRVAWNCIIGSLDGVLYPVPLIVSHETQLEKKKSVRGQLALINKVLRVLALDNLSYNIIFRF